MTKFQDYIQGKFIEFEARQGKRATVSEYADFLGINQGTLSHLMNGTREPAKNVLSKLSEVYGPEVWEAAGLLESTIGDPWITLALKAMVRLPNDQREAVARMAEQKAKEVEDKKPDSSFQFSLAV